MFEGIDLKAKETGKKWIIIVRIISYVLFLMLLILMIREKKNLHMDEVSSYIGANNSINQNISISVQYNHTYEDPAKPWMDQMCVKEDGRFDYKNVFLINSGDVHPPLYFTLLHTVCSFFPGTYSKWYAGVINIAASLLMLFAFSGILEFATEDKVFATVASAFLILCPGILSSATYFRMYHLGMFMVLAYTLVLMKGIKKRNAAFYILLGILALLGVMTHYYIAIYYLFSTLTFVVYLIVKKEYKSLAISFGTLAASAAVFLLLYPAAINHVFGGGGRGQEALDNLGYFPVYFNKIKTCFSICNMQIFGRLILLPLIVIIVFGVWGIIKNQKENGEQKTKNKMRICPDRLFTYLIPAIGITGYFVIVSIITVYTTTRYFYPIYAVTVALALFAVKNAVSKVFPKYAIIIACAVFAVCSFIHFKANIHYLYRSTQPFLDEAKKYGEVNCIIIPERPYDANTSFYEVSNYKSVTFVSPNEMDEMGKCGIDVTNGILISKSEGVSINAISEEVHETWSQLGDAIMIGEHGGMSTYYYPCVQ